MTATRVIAAKEPAGRRFTRRCGVAAAALLWLVAGSAGGAESSSPGVTHALLINGGSRPETNYQSHLHHLQEMVLLLRARGLPRERIHVFSADGADKAPDLAVRDTLPEGFWLIEGTRVGRQLKPRTEVTDTYWPGVSLRPATKAELRKWFEGAEDVLPGDHLLLFVTDHGTGNKSDPDNGAISLWGEKLTVKELRDLLGQLAPGVRTVMVMSQCFSGTFAAAIYGDPAAEPGGETCGFFSTTRDRKAYGCYPEGRDRDRLGHAFQFIDSLGREPSIDRAHLDVLVTDRTPDIPVRTSDLYLERVLAKEAAAAGLKLDTLVDSLLAEAWRDRAAWEPEIRLLDRMGETFGTFSPRNLAELESYERDLPPLVERLKTFADLWSETLVSVKEETLRQFVDALPEWRGLLDERHLDDLGAEDRRDIVGQLLPQLEWFARDRPELWRKLEALRDRASWASEARWRLQIRGAALNRMRSVLLGVAGRVWLAGESADSTASEGRGDQRRAFESLLTCEAIEPGELPPYGVATARIDPFPALADELKLLEEILPSWLGVRYRAVTEAVRAGRQIPAGASWLQAVYSDSPAMEAGLEVGDIVVGPPDRPFDWQGQLREWTMTSPRGTPLELAVVRPGSTPEKDEELVASLVLRPFPVELPELPGPPKLGDVAPPLPAAVEGLESGSLPDLRGRPRLLFFWATWCLPCRKAVPEVMAYSAAKGIPVVAITDEDPETVFAYLKKRQGTFFDLVGIDTLRRSFMTYGVSGTPTMILIGGDEAIRHRQVGYKLEEGLKVGGWSWSGS